ncbi:MAG: phenylacetate--CoA ligase family protein [Minisyncoccota bacterium]
MPDRYPFPAPFDDATTAERELRVSAPDVWDKRGEQAALSLFRAISERVPAYKDFLKKYKIRPESIQTIEDFSKLPTLDKNNYLRAYPLAALSWDGKLMDEYQLYASTSGTTGEPFYFPRARKQTEQYALLAELYLRSQYKIQDRKTLYVNCFAMGAWIGGLFTYQAVERLAERGNYPLHLITPGLAKEEALKAIRKLGSLYDQVIIGGYPPYVKDLVDQGTDDGMNWKKYRVKFVFSAEGFSEKFRDYLGKAVGQDNVLRGSLNHYGTVDLGTMAYETPLAAFIRRSALGDKKFFKEFFGQTGRLPTLAQYIPEQFYFETVSGGLVCSADAGLPLIRYDLKDQGGVWKFDDAVSAVERAVPGHVHALKDAGIKDTIFRLPFVYLYERSDFTVVLYGANIYPEHIRRALEHKACSKFATGKCAIRIVESRTREPRLEVNVELKRGLVPATGYAKLAEKEIITMLLEHNSEYRNNHVHLRRKMLPRIKLWPFADPKYFSGRGKQKWIVQKS